MDYDVIFESDRLYFIKLNDKLVNDYLNMVNDIEVQKTIGHNRRTFTVEQELSWIKSKLESNAIVFSMIDKQTNDYVGNIEIMRIVDGIGELGIAITASKQNQHYGQEAIKRFIDYAMDEYNLKGLDLHVFSFNPKGIKCYQNSGFTIDDKSKNDEEIHMTYVR